MKGRSRPGHAASTSDYDGTKPITPRSAVIFRFVALRVIPAWARPTWWRLWHWRCVVQGHRFVFTELTRAPFWKLCPVIEAAPLYAASECSRCNAFVLKPMGVLEPWPLEVEELPQEEIDRAVQLEEGDAA